MKPLALALPLCLAFCAFTARAQAPGAAMLGEARALQREGSVLAVDARRNRLTLKSSRGELTVPLGPGLPRASEFRPGEHVEVGYDVLVLALPSSAAPAGSLPAKIMDIDRERNLVSLQGERGNVLIGEASPAVLADIRVGQRVTVLVQVNSIHKLKP